MERLHDGLLASAGASGPDLDLQLGRLQVLHETSLKLRGSPHPRLAVELALLKLARIEDPRAIDEALAYLKSLEGRLVKFQAQLMEVRSSKEYSAALKEIDSVKVEISRLEDDVLAKMEVPARWAQRLIERLDRGERQGRSSGAD